MPMRTLEEQREYQRNWIKARRDAWIESQGGSCASCGSTESLEVDHIDPSTKKLQIATIWSRSAAVRESELAKCQVLCGDCHKQKTAEQLATGHGSIGKYKRGCRCLDCKEVNRQRVRRQRAQCH